MNIRKARLSDVPFILPLWSEFQIEHAAIVLARSSHKKTLNKRKKNALEIFQKFIKKTIRSWDGEVFVALNNSDIVGYTLIFIKKTNPIYVIDKVGYISDLFVDKKFRNKRISSKLKNKAIAWFKLKKIKYAAIAYNVENVHASKIYKKWDFSPDHTELMKKL